MEAHSTRHPSRLDRGKWPTKLILVILVTLGVCLYKPPRKTLREITLSIHLIRTDTPCAASRCISPSPSRARDPSL